MNLTAANDRLAEFHRIIETGAVAGDAVCFQVGVDLGTTNIVITVTGGEGQPVAGISQRASVVREGIVVDYLGAVRIVQQLKETLEQRLGKELRIASCAIPPGIHPGNVRVITNVLEGAGFEVDQVIDEPVAAAYALGLTDGAVVDVGGGTTGISILRNSEVIYSADAATGGTHMTLVLAGAFGVSFAEAEKIKLNPKEEGRIFPIVRPVVEKMAAIVQHFLAGYVVDTVYVVGGACSFKEFESVFEKSTGVRTVKPDHPLLVTPLGIALCSPSMPGNGSAKDSRGEARG